MPASIQRITSEIAAPAAGAPAGAGTVVGFVVVTAVLVCVVDGAGTVGWEVLESSWAALAQPASITDTKKSSDIRIPARLAGATVGPGEARPAAASSLPVSSRQHAAQRQLM